MQYCTQDRDAGRRSNKMRRRRITRVDARSEIRLQRLRGAAPALHPAQRQGYTQNV